MKRFPLIWIVPLLMSGVTLNAQLRKVKASELATLVKTTDHPLVINFWATWCMPCIEELSYFEKLAAMHSRDSVELILVSLDMKDDYPKKIEEFIRQRKVVSTVWWLDEHDADYFCPMIDPKWSGSLPATLMVNPRTGHRRFFEKQLSEKQLEKELTEMLHVGI
jgi:thiol-disulfide isomerase/thioredoxin